MFDDQALIILSVNKHASLFFSGIDFYAHKEAHRRIHMAGTCFFKSKKENASWSPLIMFMRPRMVKKLIHPSGI
jgi:hypothetical protein